MTLQSLRFGALRAQVTGTSTGKTITVRPTHQDAKDLADLLYPQSAKSFDGSNGVVIHMPSDVSEFNFRVQEADSQHAYKPQGSAELSGLTRLLDKLKTREIISETDYLQLLIQALKLNHYKPLVTCAMPADRDSIIAALEHDILLSQPEF